LAFDDLFQLNGGSRPELEFAGSLTTYLGKALIGSLEAVI
jgi:hypothetical protein